MIYRRPLDARVEIDTTAKSVTVVFTIPAAGGEGDVTVFAQDVTNRLSVDDRRRLRDVLVGPTSRGDTTDGKAKRTTRTRSRARAE